MTQVLIKGNGITAKLVTAGIALALATPAVTQVRFTGSQGVAGAAGVAGVDGPPGPGAVISGALGQVQYSNGAGELASAGGFVYDPATGALTLSGASARVLTPRLDLYPVAPGNGFMEFNASGGGPGLYAFGNLAAGASYNGMVIPQGKALLWCSAGDALGNTDIGLHRGGPGILEQYNVAVGSTAQTLRLYQSRTDSSNYVRGSLAVNSNQFIISGEGAGTGSAPLLYLKTANLMYLEASQHYFRNAEGVVRWQIQADGSLMPGAGVTLGASWSPVPAGYFGDVVTPKVGTGVGGGVFQFFMEGASRWQLNGSAHLIPSAHNTYDFGLVDSAPRNGYFTQFVGLVANIGAVAAPTGVAAIGNYFGGVGMYASNGVLSAIAFSNGFRVHTGPLMFGANEDLQVYRGGPDMLEQRRGLNPQGFRLFNNWVDASNNEAGVLRFVANALHIGTEAAGTGTVRSIKVVVGGENVVQVNGAGLSFGADNTYNIGYPTQFRPANIYAATAVYTPKLVQNLGGQAAVRLQNLDAAGYSGFELLDQIGGARGYLGLEVNNGLVGNIRINALGGTTTIYAASVAALTVNSSGITASGGTLTLGALAITALGSDRLSTPLNWGYQVENSVAGLKVGSAGVTFGANTFTPDTYLVRDEAANTLALRNGANAQTFNLYNTRTDASNYERFRIGWTSNFLNLVAEHAGTGTPRSVIFGTSSSGSIYFVTQNADRWVMVGAEGHFRPAVNNLHDIGSPSLTVRTGYFGTSVVTPAIASASGYSLGLGTSSSANHWNIAVGGAMEPGSSNTYDLGTSARTVRTGYFGTSVKVGNALMQNKLGNYLDVVSSNGTRLFNSYTSEAANDGLWTYRAGSDWYIAALLNGGNSPSKLGFSAFEMTFETNGAGRWKFNSSGHLLPQSAATYSIGNSSFPIGTIHATGSQTFYTAFTDASNNYGFQIQGSSGIVRLLGFANGTGNSGQQPSFEIDGGNSISFKIGGAYKMFVYSTNVSPLTNNTFDLGSDGQVFRTGWFGTQVRVINPTALTADTPVFNGSQIWNNIGAVFTALRVNVTNTASAFGSKLIDIQVGGVSQFHVDKAGDFKMMGTLFSGTASSGQANVTVDRIALTNKSSILELQDTFALGWSATPGSGGSSGTTAADLFLRRGATGVLEQYNGANAQTFRLYNTRTDASNYERLNIGFSSGVAQLLTAASGSGVAPIMQIGTLGSADVRVVTAGTNRWAFTAAGHLLPSTTNAYDIGGGSNYVNVVWAKRIVASDYVYTQPNTFAALTAPATAGNGARAFISDSTLAYTAANIGVAAAGGGANGAPVIVIGGVWVIG